MVMPTLRRVLIVAAGVACLGPASRALGDVTLAPAGSLSLPAGSSPRSLRAVDVTGDGLPDLVVTSFFAPGVHVFVNQGGFAFDAPVASPIAAVSDFDVGDVNGDGLPDLVHLSADDPTTLRADLGDGLGGFTAGSALDVSPGFIFFDAIRLFDADEDGDLDVLLQQLGDLSICLGDGLGSFAAPGPKAFTNFLALGHELHLLDANGDGHLDVVGSGNAIFPYGWALFLGDGSGSLSFSKVEYSSVDGDLSGSALGDFDGDHRLDFVMNGDDLGCPCTELVVAKGTGSDLVPATQFAVPARSRIRSADLDQDGLDDVVGMFFQGSASKFWIVLSHGDFSFGAPQVVEVADPAANMYDLALSDLDGDGVPDAMMLRAPQTISLFANLAPPSPWSDAGPGLAGSDGIPSLFGQGPLQAGTPGALKLTHANPDKLAVLFVSPSSNPTPFKGGMLVPVPPTIVVMLGTSPTGTITMPWNSWPHLPPGTDYFFQYAIVDSAGPAGASLSNAVRALQP